MKKETRPTRHNSSRRAGGELGEERERGEEKNRAENEEAPDSEDEDEREPLQAQIDSMAVRMSGMASTIYKEFIHY